MKLKFVMFIHRDINVAPTKSWTINCNVFCSFADDAELTSGTCIVSMSWFLTDAAVYLLLKVWTFPVSLVMVFAITVTTDGVKFWRWIVFFSELDLRLRIVNRHNFCSTRRRSSEKTSRRFRSVDLKLK